MDEHHAPSKSIDFTNVSKSEMYRIMISEAQGLLEGERDLIANTANISSLIYHTLNGRTPNLVNWAGFYFMRNGGLVLGPFQGKTACIRIAVGRGVCGTAVAQQKTQLVPDVHKFPGHIACDSASNSEIVVPVFQKDKVVAVIDLDSVGFGTFDEEDQQALETIAKMLAEGCDWNL